MRRAGLLEMSNSEYEEFTAYAYLFYYRVISKHLPIAKNLKKYVKDFFKEIYDLNKESMSNVKAKADRLFSSP
jgi:hypothetical protein